MSASNPTVRDALAAVDSLRELVKALDGAFISSWQSTAAWQGELDRARALVAEIDGVEE